MSRLSRKRAFNLVKSPGDEEHCLQLHFGKFNQDLNFDTDIQINQLGQPSYIFSYPVKLGFKELFDHHKKVPYFKHLTKVPYKVYLMKNQGKMAIFLESILLLTKIPALCT